MLNGSVVQAPAGLKCFDCDTIVSPQAAVQFRAHGYGCAIRYVGRHATAARDVRLVEATEILAAGLGLQLVQHVQQPGWIPSGDLGTQYGAFAAASATAIGYPPGGMIWCDLEGVASGDHVVETIAFLNNWINQVGHAGFTPGCYVGYAPGLNAVQFYSQVHFEHYWGAYNVDIVPSVRGFQVQQHTQQTLAGITFDPSTIMADKLGGLPLIVAPPGWTLPV
jgi:hypothetical protein